MTTLVQFARLYPTISLGIKPRSVEQLVVAARQFAAWAGGSLPFAKLSDELLTAYLADLARRRRPATVNSKRRAILTVWRAAARKGLVKPPGEIPKMPEPYRMPEAWTIAEVEYLLAQCRMLDGVVGDVPRRHWWPALLLTVYDTGGRIGAVRAVQTADYNPSERYVIFRAENQKPNRDELHWLSDQTVAALAAVYDPQRSLLFPWPHHRQYLWTYFRRLVDRIGLNGGRNHAALFHKLRRTSGSYIEAAGGDGAQHLGHLPEVFARSYRDPRICRRRQVDLLPRPKF